METEFGIVGDLVVMIIYDYGVYEYYVRFDGDPRDVFDFCFGVEEKIPVEELDYDYLVSYKSAV